MNQLSTQAHEAKPPINTGELSIFSNIKRFQEVQQMADFLSQSDLVPEAFKGKPANCVIALAMADRMQADPMMIMQNLHVITGRPSWSSQFLIACINNSGRFTALQYEYEEGGAEEVSYEYTVGKYPNKQTMTGKVTVKNDRCRAFATDLTSRDVVYGPWVSVEMAVKEGWYTKAGSKWKTMPELMLTYRAAAFFVRTKAPEISMGMSTVEEERDMGKAEVVSDIRPRQRQQAVQPESLDAEVLGLVKQDQKVQPEQPEFDYVKFCKQAIDSCPDLESLNQCGADIAQDIKQLQEDQQFEVRSYYDKKLKALKAH